VHVDGGNQRWQNGIIKLKKLWRDTKLLRTVFIPFTAILPRPPSMRGQTIISRPNKKKEILRGPVYPLIFRVISGSTHRLPATRSTETTKHTSLSLLFNPPFLLKRNSPLGTRSSTLFTGRDRDRALQP